MYTSVGICQLSPVWAQLLWWILHDLRFNLNYCYFSTNILSQRPNSPVKHLVFFLPLSLTINASTFLSPWQVFSNIEEYAPGFTDSIVGMEVLTPPDLESIFGLTRGVSLAGSFMLHSLDGGTVPLETLHTTWQYTNLVRTQNLYSTEVLLIPSTQLYDYFNVSNYLSAEAQIHKMLLK